MKHKNFYLCTLLICLGACTHRIHDPIPQDQLLLKSPQREKTALELYQRAQAAETFAQASQLYTTITTKYAETSSAPKARHMLGNQLIRKGKYVEGIQQLQFISQNYPEYPAYAQVIEAQFQATQNYVKFQERQSSKCFTWFKDATPAIAFFQNIADAAPYTDYAPRSLYYVAKLEQKYGKKVKAIEALDQLIENYPSHALIPKVQVLKAEIYLSFVLSPHNDQGATQKAIQCYEKFFITFDKQDLSEKLRQRAKQGLERAQNLFAQSRLVLGDFFLYKRHYSDGAITFYTEAQMLAPSSEAAAQAHQRIDDIYQKKPIPCNWADKMFGIFQHLPPSALPQAFEQSASKPQ